MPVSRREFIGHTLAASSLRGAQTGAPRPNILWLSNEDMSPLLGCYGDAHAITPNLDALAKRSVRYTHAYTTAGVCAPSRSCIITGVYQSTLGSQNMRSSAPLPDFVKCFPEYLRGAGYYCTNNQKTDYNFPVPEGAWDESSGKAHYRNRRAGQPFFAVFNNVATHESQVRAPAEAFAKQTARLTPRDRQDPARLTLPPYYPDTPAVRRQWANHYELNTAMDYWAGDMVRQLEEDNLADDTIVFYWSDHGSGLPRAKRWLYESSTHVPLIVHIPEKFRRDGQGTRGSVSEELISFVDLAPTVLNLAGVPVPSHMQGRAFLGPKLQPARQYVFGMRDRMDERYDIIRSVRDKRYRYIRNYEAYKPYSQFLSYCEQSPVMQELRRVKAEGTLPPAAAHFMADRKPVEELYDAESDPHETKNLVGSVEHRAVLERLRKAHLTWMEETRDLALVPEPELEKAGREFGSRYAILRTPENKDLPRRLRQIVELGEQGKPALARLVAALGDAEPGVRYWAATGIGNLGEDAATVEEALRKALQDSSGMVRVAAARALWKAGKAEAALPVLTAELKGGEQWVRLYAVIVLDEMGSVASPAVRSLQDALKDENDYVRRVATHAVEVLA